MPSRSPRSITANPSRTRFGALEFRGGLELTSKDQRFGGISALHMAADGSHFLALTRSRRLAQGPHRLPAGTSRRPCRCRDGADAGVGWQAARQARLVRHRIARPRTAPATPMSASSASRRIVRFDLKKGLRARGQPIPVPPRFKTLRQQQEPGMPRRRAEGLTARRQTHRRHRAQPRRGRQSPRLSAAGQHFETFSVKRSDDFDISDCAILPPNDLLLLERSYSPLTRRRHAHPPHSAGGHQARRAGRRQAADRRRPRLSDRQHGRHRRLARRQRRHDFDAGVGRQFLGASAHAAAAVQVGEVGTRLSVIPRCERSEPRRATDQLSD